MKKLGMTKVKLCKLQVHPEQAALFAPLSPEELQELASDMEDNGLQHAVEILADNTIVAGHQRVQAAKLLGWTEIDVVIRHDLSDADAAVSRLINDNLHRRQLSGLAKARCYKRLMKLHAATNGHVGPAELVEALARRLGQSSRNIQRYLRAMEAPMEVQEAFDRGRLSLLLTSRVCHLAHEKQKDIARRICAGESPKLVVQEYLQVSRELCADYRSRLERIHQMFRREFRELEQQVDEIHPDDVGPHRVIFKRAIKILRAIVKLHDDASDQGEG